MFSQGLNDKPRQGKNDSVGRPWFQKWGSSCGIKPGWRGHRWTELEWKQGNWAQCSRKLGMNMPKKLILSNQMLCVLFYGVDTDNKKNGFQLLHAAHLNASSSFLTGIQKKAQRRLVTMRRQNRVSWPQNLTSATVYLTVHSTQRDFRSQECLELYVGPLLEEEYGFKLWWVTALGLLLSFSIFTPVSLKQAGWVGEGFGSEDDRGRKAPFFVSE